MDDLNYTIVDANVRVHVNLTRQFGDANLKRAQYWLDSQIMTDMLPLMPIRTGSLQQRSAAESASHAGTGRVIAGAGPYGRFQYYGMVMVDPETNSPWAQLGAKKVVTERPLQYSSPRAVPRWFETAKAQHIKQWIEGVKKILGGR